MVELFDYTFECLPTTVETEFPLAPRIVYADDMYSGVQTVENEDVALEEWIDNDTVFKPKKKSSKTKAVKKATRKSTSLFNEIIGMIVFAALVYGSYRYYLSSAGHTNNRTTTNLQSGDSANDRLTEFG